MVSSSQVGDAIRVRCADADAVDKSVAVTSVSTIGGSFVSMTSPNEHPLAIRRPTQDHAGHERFAGVIDWPRQTALPPI